MKVLVNGGINVSELDGWWAEAYTPQVGWALGDGQEHGDDPAHDIAEAEALYALLEDEVIPEFYDRDVNGIPTRWMRRVRNSMGSLTPRFSTNRTVREYTEQRYLPAAKAYRARAADGCAQGVQLLRWWRNLEKRWAALRFGDVNVATADGQHVFEVQVHLDAIEPTEVRVELYVDDLEGRGATTQEMKRLRPLPDVKGGYVYGVRAPATLPAWRYTPRIVPHREGVSVPLEAAFILWQR
jgi:starch phosphorylase